MKTPEQWDKEGVCYASVAKKIQDDALAAAEKDYVELKRGMWKRLNEANEELAAEKEKSDNLFKVARKHCIERKAAEHKLKASCVLIRELQQELETPRK